MPWSCLHCMVKEAKLSLPCTLLRHESGWTLAWLPIYLFVMHGAQNCLEMCERTVLVWHLGCSCFFTACTRMTVSATQNLGVSVVTSLLTSTRGHAIKNACNSLEGAKRATAYGRVRLPPTTTRIGRYLIRHELELPRIFNCIVLAHIQWS